MEDVDMVSTKDLRDIFNDLTTEAGKKANDALKNAKIPELSIGRRNEPPGLLWFGIGLTLGAVIGMLVAFVASPMSGVEARQKIGEQVDKVRRSREEASTYGTNGSSTYASPTSPTTPTSPYERS
jgi:hypothetical protein